MVIRQTSLEAYNSLDINKRQKTVYDGFKVHGEHTNLEISQILCLPINQVTPRTNELYKKGLLYNKYKKVCDVSGRTAICWSVSSY